MWTVDGHDESLGMPRLACLDSSGIGRFPSTFVYHQILVTKIHELGTGADLACLVSLVEPTTPRLIDPL